MVSAAYTSQQTSMCEDDYALPINLLAKKIIARLR